MERHLYIISGCNGAGKTTAAYTVLPEVLNCQEFVNADEIARGLSPLNPESVAVEAGRLMLMRIDQLLAAGQSFSIETTLATRSYLKLVERAHRAGYTVHLLYFWLESPELALQRVAKRVSEGGHNIPEDVVRRRYKLGLSNLFQLYIPVVDEWVIFDNMRPVPLCIAQRQMQQEETILVPTTYEKIISTSKLCSANLH